jgi:hypothetical protein
MFRCNMMDQCEAPECHHYKPHRPHSLSTSCGVDICRELDNVPWCIDYFPHPDAVELADTILAWWDDNKYNTVSLDDGDEDNMFDGEPDFVMEARKIKEEVKEECKR